MHLSCRGVPRFVTSMRLLQAAVAKCIKTVVSEAAFSRMMNLMNQSYMLTDDYATQYVDVLNCRFLAMNKEKRLKNISVMAKRLAEQGDEYKAIKSEV